MSDFLDLLQPAQAGVNFGPFDIILVAGMSALCTFILCKVYQSTHRGTSYSQSYIHSLFLMALCTGIVMMIIGSNIARAFSLVGALSIIRFRTAVKDVRDTAYLFFAVVIGMGCGTGFFLHIAVFTLVTCLFMWLLHRFDFALKQETEEILKITYQRAGQAAEDIASLLQQELPKKHRLINSVRNLDEATETQVYVVQTRHGELDKDLDNRLSTIEGVSHVALYVHDQQVDL